MKKGMNIVYRYKDNLYVNLTNRCPCRCTFCLRQDRDTVGGEADTLWLEHEPSMEEIKKAFIEADVKRCSEVVFCGYGEPTEAFDRLKETAKWLKDNYGKIIRLNTNGLGNLVNERNIIPEMKGLIDSVSISLNTPDVKDYMAIVRPKFGDKSFKAMLDFAKDCAKIIPDVTMSTVSTTISHEQEEECRKICESIGVKYRIRPIE